MISSGRHEMLEAVQVRTGCRGDGVLRGTARDARVDLATIRIYDPDHVDMHSRKRFVVEIRGQEVRVAVLIELLGFIPLRIVAIADSQLPQVSFKCAID